MDWRDIHGKTAVVTGASSGIGEHVARELAKVGCNVALIARRKERLDQIVDELREFGCKALALSGDVTKPDTLQAAVDRTHQKLGDIHMVFANAGFGVSGPLETLTTDDYRRQFDVNIFGVLNTIYTTLEDLKKTRGRLAITGSVAGYIMPPISTPYTMSKHAVKALAVGISHELKEHGISVTLVSPGFVKSEIFQIDNQGKFQADKKNLVPPRLLMPTDEAAQQILEGVIKRKQEVLVTKHAWFGKHIHRLFPNLVNYLTGRGAYAKYKKQQLLE